MLKEVVILNNLREQVVRLYNTDKFNVDHVNNIHKLTRVGNILRELSILPVSSYNLENYSPTIENKSIFKLGPISPTR